MEDVTLCLMKEFHPHKLVCAQGEEIATTTVNSHNRTARLAVHSQASFLPVVKLTKTIADGSLNG